MAEAVYLLNVLCCIAVAVLLFRGYGRSRARLLFWSGLCFVGMAVNNVILFVDLVILPHTDLSLARSVVALISLAVLLFGLIGEAT